MDRSSFTSLKKSKKSGRAFVGPLLKAVLSTLLCLLLLEVYFRLFNPQTGLRIPGTSYLPPCFMYDPVISWTLYPGARVVHNARAVFGRSIPVRISSGGY